MDRAIARIRKCHELGYQLPGRRGRAVVFRPRGPQAFCWNKTGFAAGSARRSTVCCASGLMRRSGTAARCIRCVRACHRGRRFRRCWRISIWRISTGRWRNRGASWSGTRTIFWCWRRRPEEAQQALLQTETLLAEAHLSLNEREDAITDFEHGFRFLGALFTGDAHMGSVEVRPSKGPRAVHGASAAGGTAGAVRTGAAQERDGRGADARGVSRSGTAAKATERSGRHGVSLPDGAGIDSAQGRRPADCGEGGRGAAGLCRTTSWKRCCCSATCR